MVSKLSLDSIFSKFDSFISGDDIDLEEDWLTADISLISGAHVEISSASDGRISSGFETYDIVFTFFRLLEQFSDMVIDFVCAKSSSTTE